MVDLISLMKISYKNQLQKAIHGTTRALINNMIKGVHEGYRKSLTLVGVGYRAATKGSEGFLLLNNLFYFCWHCNFTVCNALL